MELWEREKRAAPALGVIYYESAGGEGEGLVLGTLLALAWMSWVKQKTENN